MNKNIFKQSPQQAKLLLLVIIVAIFVIASIVILTQNIFLDRKTETQQNLPTITKNQPQAETTTTSSAPSAPSAPSVITEKDQKQLQILKDQVKAGTLSVEEARKKIIENRDIQEAR